MGKPALCGRFLVMLDLQVAPIVHVSQHFRSRSWEDLSWHAILSRWARFVDASAAKRSSLGRKPS